MKRCDLVALQAGLSAFSVITIGMNNTLDPSISKRQYVWQAKATKVRIIDSRLSRLFRLILR